MAIRNRIIEFHPLLIAVATILISSCVQPLEIKTDWDEPPVVVHCVLKRIAVDLYKDAQYTTQTVELCYASAAGQDGFPNVQEAEVAIHCKESGETYTFINEGNGVWSSEFTPDYDCTYSLEIKIPGRETITAETRVPEKVSLFMPLGVMTPDDSATVEKAGLVPPCKEMGGGLIGCIRGDAKDYNTKHDIYVWIRHSQGCDLTTDHIYADDCNVSSRQYSAELFSPDDLALRRFLKSRKGIIPYCFGLPLHKGFLRIVNPTDYCICAPNKYGIVKDEKVVPSPDYDRAFVILGDFTYKDPSYYKKLEDYDYLEMRVVSEDLDKYYRDVYSFQNTNMDNLFNMVYASGNLISSNIKNGFGVFGAEVTNKHAAVAGGFTLEKWPSHLNPDFFWDW